MVSTSVHCRLLRAVLQVGAAAMWVCLIGPVPGHAETTVPSDQSPPAYVLIAHPSVVQSEVSQSDLQAIALGRLRYWSAGRPIQLVLGPEGSVSRQLWVEDIAEMSAAQFNQFWIGATFRGRAVIAPRGVPNDDIAARLVAVLPGAIAIVPVDFVSTDVRVLRLENAETDDALMEVLR